MLWPSIAFGLVGVIGLLFGLLERNRAKALQGQVDTISKTLAQEKANSSASSLRYESFVSDLKAKVDSLTKELDDKLPKEALLGRFNDLFSGGMQDSSSEGGKSTGGLPVKPAT